MVVGRVRLTGESGWGLGGWVAGWLGGFVVRWSGGWVDGWICVKKNDVFDYLLRAIMKTCLGLF